MAKTVLIVEDNELNMKLFRDLLEAHGYQTSGTSNGFEALDLVRKLRPDLILMDIQHVLAHNPTEPAYAALGSAPIAPAADQAPSWRAVPGGLYEIGHRGDGFAFEDG